MKWKIFDHAYCTREDVEITVVGFVKFVGLDFVKGQYLAGEHVGEYGLFLDEELAVIE